MTELAVKRPIPWGAVKCLRKRRLAHADGEKVARLPFAGSCRFSFAAKGYLVLTPILLL